MEQPVTNKIKPSINLYSNTSQVMNDAIDRIVVEIHNKRKTEDGAQKILLTGCGPQCGSTSVCIGLGISFAEAKWNTLIIDCDIRKSAPYKKLNENTGKGLSDFLLGESVEQKEDFEEIIYATNFENLSYIPCGTYAASPARLFCSGMMKKLLEYVNEQYDYVIFDFPSVAVAPDAQILFGDVDGIILISALECVTKRQIRDAKHKVQPFADKYYGMIINKIDMSLYKKYVKRYDYYFLDKNGNQKLGGNVPQRYRRQLAGSRKGETKNEKVVK
jgi:capsular exopolysaccharide synthesis family protein